MSEETIDKNEETAKVLDMTDEEYSNYLAKIGENTIENSEQNNEDSTDGNEEDYSEDDTDNQENEEDYQESNEEEEDTQQDDEEKEDDNNEEDDSEDDSEEQDENTDNEKSDKETDTDVKLINKEDLPNYKFSIKWKGKNAIVDGEKIVNYAQMGIDYSINKHLLREAEAFKSIADNVGVDSSTIEAIGNLKKGVTDESLKKFLATLDVDIDDIKESLIDIDNDEVTDTKNEMIKNREEINPIDSLFETMDQSSKSKVYNLVENFYGFRDYLYAITQSKDTNLFSQVMSSVESGAFDKVAEEYNSYVLGSSEIEKQKLKSPNYFSKVVNDFASNTKNVSGNRQQPKKPKLSSKKSFSQSSKNVTRTSKHKKKTKDEILNEVLSMSESEYKSFLNKGFK